MADRDKYGNYVNEKGVTIKVSSDKNGKDHINFYKGDVDGSHDAVHVNVNYDKGSWSSKTHNSDNSEKSSGSGGCYLTSACMQHLQQNFDDKCYELNILRWFRDNFVTKEDIKHYYEVAPVIVENINEDKNANAIYNYIYNNIVSYCVEQIKQGNYEEAYDRYKSSVIVLEEKFAKPKLMSRLTRTLQTQLNY